MLKTRVITAVVLLAVFLSALFFLPVLGWAWFAALIAAIAGWEWGGLLRLSPRGQVAFGAIVFVSCALVILGFPEAIGMTDKKHSLCHSWAPEAWRLGRWFYLPAVCFWCILVPIWLRRHWNLQRKVWSGFAVGFVVILPTWLALVQLRNLMVYEYWQLLIVMAVVWVSDTSAYFSGRAFGKRKLAPRISPGKTWAGVWGAIIGVLIYGFVLALIFSFDGMSGTMILIGLGLVVLGIFGDLFESLLKRQAGMKDSSMVLPGHGGVLDRIDSLTSTLPAVALIVLIDSLRCTLDFSYFG